MTPYLSALSNFSNSSSLVMSSVLLVVRMSCAQTNYFENKLRVFVEHIFCQFYFFFD